MRCRVAVGTSNPLKVRGVVEAFKLLCTPEVTAVEVSVSVGRQPLGLENLLKGALERAWKALERVDADYGVGVEAGAFMLTGIPIELQVAVVLEKSGRIGVGLSQGFMIPASWYERMREGVELGVIAEEVTSRRNIRRGLGLIGYLTKGIVTRQELTRQAVLMALLPWLNPKLYTKQPTVEELLEKLAKG